MKYLVLTIALLFSGLANAAQPILCDELANDPLARGYAAMNNAEAAFDLNTAYRQRIKSSMTGSEVFQAIDITEFMALTVDNRSLIAGFFTWNTVNPTGNEVNVFKDVFGLGSTTISNLIQERIELIPRGEELGLGWVMEGWVLECRP